MGRRVLFLECISGGDGMMGQTIKKLTIESNYIYKFINRNILDLTDRNRVLNMFKYNDFAVSINSLPNGLMFGVLLLISDPILQLKSPININF